jgi:hypothetical protein
MDTDMPSRTVRRGHTPDRKRRLNPPEHFANSRARTDMPTINTPQLGSTTVWDLAIQCDAPLPVVIHQAVGLGAWQSDGSVEPEWAETLRSVLRSQHAAEPLMMLSKASADEGIVCPPEKVADVLLAVQAVGSRIGLADVARRLGVSIEVVGVAIAPLAERGLVKVDEEEGTVIALAARARELAALARGELATD